MSEFRVEVAEVKNVQKHPNADTLSIAEVNGYPVIFRTGEYTEGSLAVHVEAGQLTERERAIYAIEYAECGCATATERRRWALHAVDMERSKVAMGKRVVAVHGGNLHGSAKRVFPPANAEELRATVVKHAMKIFHMGDESEFLSLNNHKERWFVLVALSSIPAESTKERRVRNGETGPRRATLIAGFGERNNQPSLWRARLLERYPEAYREAVKFGRGLVAKWNDEGEGR